MTTPHPEQAQVEGLREQAHEAARQALSDAMSAGHPLGGAMAISAASESEAELREAIDALALAALRPQAPQPEAAEPVAAPVQPVAQWIPIAEMVPEPEVFVLCWDGRTTFVEWFGSKPDAGRGVTHWLPYELPPGATSDMHDGRRALATPPVSVERDAEYEVHQDHGEWTEFAAGTDGPAELALAEAMHYARQYAADGPVKVFRVARIEVAALAQAGDKEQQT